MRRKAFFCSFQIPYSLRIRQLSPGVSLFYTFLILTRTALCKTLNNTSTDWTKPLALWLIISSYYGLTILPLSAEIQNIEQNQYMYNATIKVPNENNDIKNRLFLPRLCLCITNEVFLIGLRIRTELISNDFQVSAQNEGNFCTD